MATDRMSFVRVLLAAALALTLPFIGAVAEGRADAARPADAHRGLDPGLVAVGAEPTKVIVTGARDVAAAVTRAGGRVTADLPLVGGVAATIPAGRLSTVAADRRVRAVTADRVARFEEFTYDDTTTASNFARTTGATTAWAAGNHGSGVGVAVLDTGISPQPDFAGRLVHGPDLSGEGSTIDSYGHGTVMAGIIAGSGADSQQRSGGAFTGIAPLAHVVSVKVAGRNGVVDVSTILQGMHWVSAYREQFGIRVLNLAWGVPSTQSPNLDPLNHAVQRLWNEGIVVVVAAGNSGPQNGTVTKPGDDPVVLTVGAFNDQGDADPGNDNVPSWSSRGPTAAGVSKPDVVVPGRTIISPRSLGSAVEAANPKALLAPSYIKGSGTSQASAVASGAIALLLAKRPDLTPDQVKALLMQTASPIASVGRNTQGTGRIDLARALSAEAPAAVQPLTATGLGSIEASRAGRNVVADCDGVRTEIRGEVDVRCQPWNPADWTSSAWDGEAWTGVSWKGAEWTGVSWKNVGWSDATWTGVSWKGGTWTADAWAGRSWTGSGVTDAWAGVSWKDATWTGVSWKEAAWTTGEWTAGEYDAGDWLTAWWGGTPPPGRRVAGEAFTARPAQPGR